MATRIHNVETIINTDENGIQTTTTKETSTRLERIDEPDYVKLYTRVWCEFNEIPLNVRPLFLELVSRMTYCDASDLEHSQLVYVIEPASSQIASKLGVKKNMLSKQLKALCECGAIKSVSRGVYQINPSYAGKGEWKYNPKLARGGVKDLVATFNFAKGTCQAKIVWADVGTDHPMNEAYRAGLGVKASDETILRTSKVQTAIDDELTGMQISLNDILTPEERPQGSAL